MGTTARPRSISILNRLKYVIFMALRETRLPGPGRLLSGFYQRVRAGGRNVRRDIAPGMRNGGPAFTFGKVRFKYSPLPRGRGDGNDTGPVPTDRPRAKEGNA